MAEGDKKIMCQICGAVFLFTRQQQASFKKKGYTNIPRRCPECRKKKTGYPGTHKGKQAKKQSFSVKCSGCSRFFQTSTKPHPGTPVYCKACKSLNRDNLPNWKKRR